MTELIMYFLNRTHKLLWAVFFVLLNLPQINQDNAVPITTLMTSSNHGRNFFSLIVQCNIKNQKFILKHLLIISITYASRFALFQTEKMFLYYFLFDFYFCMDHKHVQNRLNLHDIKHQTKISC